jgi:hypothetical protein
MPILSKLGSVAIPYCNGICPIRMGYNYFPDITIIALSTPNAAYRQDEKSATTSGETLR